MTYLPVVVFQKILCYCDDRIEQRQRHYHGKTLKMIKILRNLGTKTGLGFLCVTSLYMGALEEFGGSLYPSQDGRQLHYLPPARDLRRYGVTDREEDLLSENSLQQLLAQGNISRTLP